MTHRRRNHSDCIRGRRTPHQIVTHYPTQLAS